MKSILLHIFIAFITLTKGIGQEVSSFEKVAKITGKITYFAVDDLLNIYTLNTKNEVVKYDIDGNELFRYTNNQLGAIKSIDVSNPLNILLFFPEYQSAITLNRTLTNTGNFDFFDTEILDISALCLSRDNKIWLYDASNFKLKLLDNTITVEEESDDLSYYLDTPDTVKQMRVHENWVYLNMPAIGIVIFDDFGQFDKVLPYKNVQDFNFVANELLFQIEGELFALHLETLQKRKIKTPRVLSNENLVQVKNGYFFILEKGGKLEVFGTH